MATSQEFGLFGATPEQLAQMRDEQLRAEAMRYGQMDANQRNSAAMYEAGARMVAPVMGMLGYKHQPTEQARQRQEIASQFDINTPEGLVQAAQAFTQAGMPNEARIAVERARQLQVEQSRLAKEAADTKRLEAIAERNLKLAEEAGKPKPNYKLTKVGVPGKPNMTQSVLIDLNDPTAAPIDVGAPQQMGKAGRRAGSGASAGTGSAVTGTGGTTGAVPPPKTKNGIADLSSFTPNTAGMTPAQRGKFIQQYRGAVSSLGATDDNLADVAGQVELILNHKGAPYATGFIMGSPLVPTARESARDYIAQVETLKGKLTKLAKDAISESGKIGSMQVQEWQIILNQLLNADRQMGTDDFNNSIRNALSDVTRSRNTKYKNVYSTYGLPADTPVPPVNPAKKVNRWTTAGSEPKAPVAPVTRKPQTQPVKPNQYNFKPISGAN